MNTTVNPSSGGSVELRRELDGRSSRASKVPEVSRAIVISGVVLILAPWTKRDKTS